jgi:tRNA (guanine37-N1)-methyltransferase
VVEGVVELNIHNLRSWSGNRWGQIDDEPYGGGAGMVIQAPPVLAAVRDIRGDDTDRTRTILLSPRGQRLDHELAEELSLEPRLLLLCGRYEGFDERVNDILRPDEISLGDFILGGGEVAAMALVESVSRLIPGVVGDPRSVTEDSFAHGLLDFPAYTRPLEVEGREVPSVLRSGNHEKVRHWRLERAVEATVTRRPDLVKKHWNVYSGEVRRLVRRWAPDLADELE